MEDGGVDVFGAGGRECRGEIGKVSFGGHPFGGPDFTGGGVGAEGVPIVLLCFLDCFEVGVVGMFHVEDGSYVFLPCPVGGVKDAPEDRNVGALPRFGLEGGSAQGSVFKHGGHDLFEGGVQPYVQLKVGGMGGCEPA